VPERFSAQARLRARTFGYTYLLHKGKYFSVQARASSGARKDRLAKGFY
jgi:hypothetical protein